MRIEKTTLVVRSAGPVETTVGDEIVLMVLDSGKCYGLGETGSEIWRLLEEPTAAEPVVRALRAEYEAPEGEIERDVMELLERLLDEGLIETVV